MVLVVLVLLLREELSLEDRFGVNLIHILGLNVQIPASLFAFFYFPVFCRPLGWRTGP